MAGNYKFLIKFLSELVASHKEKGKDDLLVVCEPLARSKDKNSLRSFNFRGREDCLWTSGISLAGRTLASRL